MEQLCESKWWLIFWIFPTKIHSCCVGSDNLEDFLGFRWLRLSTTANDLCLLGKFNVEVATSKKDDDKVPSRRDFRSYAISLVVDYFFVVLPVLLILTVWALIARSIYHISNLFFLFFGSTNFYIWTCKHVRGAFIVIYLGPMALMSFNLMCICLSGII